MGTGLIRFGNRNTRKAAYLAALDGMRDLLTSDTNIINNEQGKATQ
jgi:hypothetical protein